MTVFDSQLGITRKSREKKEENRNFQAEERQKTFIRDRDVFAAAMEDDSLTIQQNRETSDLTRWQQDLSDDIKEIIHDLKREVLVDGDWEPQKVFMGYDKDENEVWHLVPPMLNEVGIRAVISLLKPLTSRNLMMSNYDEEKILRKMRRVLYTLIIHMGYNQKYYNVSKSDLSAIVQMFRDIAEPAHWRSMNNGERRFLTSHTKRIETHSDGANILGQSKKFGGLFK